MNSIAVYQHENVDVIDSRQVAEMIGKPHNDLMKSIRVYCKHLTEGDTEGDFSLSGFFVESTYEDSTGRALPCFLITKKGCDMIANKLTGKKGTLFTAAYVTAFEQMRESLSPSPVAVLAPTTADYLKAAQILAKCPQERLNQVEAVLEAAGIKCRPEQHRVFRKLRQYSEEERKDLAGKAKKAIKNSGRSLETVAKLTGLDIFEISECFYGWSEPHPEVSEHIIETLESAKRTWVYESDEGEGEEPWQHRSLV